MDESSDSLSAETQATQLMNMIAGTRPTSSREKSLSLLSTPVGEQDVLMSETSSTSEYSRQLPPNYMADAVGWVENTQSETQTQLSGPGKNCDSQKENTPLSRSPIAGRGLDALSVVAGPEVSRNGAPMRSAPILSSMDHNPAFSTNAASVVSRNPFVPSTPSFPPGSKAVSFVSPRGPPDSGLINVRMRSKPLTTIPSVRNSRSLSPLSQDSFVGPIRIQDPVAHRLATDSIFDIPADQLGAENSIPSSGSSHSGSQQAGIHRAQTLPFFASKFRSDKTSLPEMHHLRSADTSLAVSDSQDSHESDMSAMSIPSGQQLDSQQSDESQTYGQAQLPVDYSTSHAEESIRLVFSQESPEDLALTQSSERLSQYYMERPYDGDGNTLRGSSPSQYEATQIVSMRQEPSQIETQAITQVMTDISTGQQQLANNILGKKEALIPETPILSEVHSIATTTTGGKSLASTVRDQARLARLGITAQSFTPTTVQTPQVAATATAVDELEPRKAAQNLLNTVSDPQRVARLTELGPRHPPLASMFAMPLPKAAVELPPALAPSSPELRKRTHDDMEDTQLAEDINTSIVPRNYAPTPATPVVHLPQQVPSLSPCSSQRIQHRDKRQRLQPEEIVPDSETNFAEENASSIPSSAPEQDVSHVPHTSRLASVKRSVNEDLTEIVPDSLEVADESADTSDDIPLMLTAARHKGPTIKQKPVMLRHYSDPDDVSSQGETDADDGDKNNDVSKERHEVKGEEIEDHTKSLQVQVKARTILSPELAPSRTTRGRGKKQQAEFITPGKFKPQVILERPAHDFKSETDAYDSPDELADAPIDTANPPYRMSSSTRRRNQPGPRPSVRRTLGTDSSRSSRMSRATSPSYTATEIAEDDDGDDYETQIANDDMYLDFKDALPVPSVPPPTRGFAKRKGGQSVKTTSLPATRGSFKPKNMTSASSRSNSRTPRPDSDERQHLPSSSPTRVFAFWKSNKSYYAGVVEQHLEGRLYDIHFDDGEQDTVELSKIRQCALRVGDIVSLSKKAKGTVAKVYEAEGEPWIVVSSAKGEVEVPLSDISIPAKIIDSNWADRTIKPNEIHPRVGASSHALRRSPAKQPSHLRRVPSGSGLGSLAGTAVVLTSTSADLDTRDKVSRLVCAAGGVVVGDWSELFPMVGRHDKTRWTASQKDVTYRGPREIQRIFLLSDQDNNKPKYLRAIALGVPCLSFNWVLDNKGRPPDEWYPYLLPAGTCKTLGTRISQMVDLSWGSDPKYIREIRSGKVVTKLFEKKTILIIGEDYWLSQAQPSNDEQPFQCVPRVILAMGAALVEAVVQENEASKDLSDYDFVVMQAFEPRSDANCVDWEWVKDCLISNRLLPLPIEDDDD